MIVPYVQNEVSPVVVFNWSRPLLVGGHPNAAIALAEYNVLALQFIRRLERGPEVLQSLLGFWIACEHRLFHHNTKCQSVMGVKVARQMVRLVQDGRMPLANGIAEPFKDYRLTGTLFTTKDGDDPRLAFWLVEHL